MRASVNVSGAPVKTPLLACARIAVVGRLEGNVAIVTGAAGGIGRAMVVRFVEQGAQVVAADVDEERVVETAELAGATPRVTDVSRPTTSSDWSRRRSSATGS